MGSRVQQQSSLSRSSYLTSCFLHRWLASDGQVAAAEQALRSLRGPEDVEADVSEMQQAVEAESKLQSWTLLLSPAVRAELKVGESLWCP